MQISIERLDKELELPNFANEHDAGLDLRSAEDQKLAPGEKKIVKTGIKVAIPEGYVGLIWDRSGMAAKYSMHTMAGVIDSGYRGEVGIVIINLGTEDFYIEKGMRIAQMVIQPVLNTKVIEVNKLAEEETERGAGGFGSSGLK
ncbi:dUTP diphosphatase [Candidatus Woesearchaeota archaeon]|nr:MAG: dUTP diphosphatase [Candidatus Woesearchaeota archaeon]